MGSYIRNGIDEEAPINSRWKKDRNTECRTRDICLIVIYEHPCTWIYPTTIKNPSVSDRTEYR